MINLNGPQPPKWPAESKWIFGSIFHSSIFFFFFPLHVSEFPLRGMTGSWDDEYLDMSSYQSMIFFTKGKACLLLKAAAHRFPFEEGKSAA